MSPPILEFLNVSLIAAMDMPSAHGCSALSPESCKGMDARCLQDRTGRDEITVPRTTAGCASPSDRPFSAGAVDFVSWMGTKSTDQPI